MRVIMAAVLMLNMAGCSIYKAATAPPPVAVDRVTVGTSRAEVMSVFGSPKNSDSAINGKTDIYEFIDGNNGASKLRILPYIAADVYLRWGWRSLCCGLLRSPFCKDRKEGLS